MQRSRSYVCDPEVIVDENHTERVRSGELSVAVDSFALVRERDVVVERRIS